jgi:hypothetical protein
MTCHRDLLGRGWAFPKLAKVADKEMAILSERVWSASDATLGSRSHAKARLVKLALPSRPTPPRCPTLALEVSAPMSLP